MHESQTTWTFWSSDYNFTLRLDSIDENSLQRSHSFLCKERVKSLQGVKYENSSTFKKHFFIWKAEKPGKSVGERHMHTHIHTQLVHFLNALSGAGLS